MDRLSINDQQEQENSMAGQITQGMSFVISEKNKLWKSEIQDSEDIEVMWIQNFRFKAWDVIQIISAEVWESITFHILRNNEKCKNDEGKIIEFIFNRLIFIQRFRTKSDIEEILLL